MFGLVGDGPTNQRELAWAEIIRGDNRAYSVVAEARFRRDTGSRQVFQLRGSEGVQPEEPGNTALRFR